VIFIDVVLLPTLTENLKFTNKTDRHV